MKSPLAAVHDPAPPVCPMCKGVSWYRTADAQPARSPVLLFVIIVALVVKNFDSMEVFYAVGGAFLVIGALWHRRHVYHQCRGCGYRYQTK